MQHHLRHAAGEEHAHRRDAGRSAARRRGAARGGSRRASRRWSDAARPAAWAMAGMCSSRLVEPPKAAWTTIALRIAASVTTSRDRQSAARAGRARRGPSGAPCRARSVAPRAPARCAAPTARAPRRRPARSRPCRGTGSRRRATRRRGSPSRPPPRARSSRARSGRRSSAPSRRPRRRSAGSVTPPGTITPGRSCAPASAIIMAGRPLSQVATPITPTRVGSDRISRPQHHRRVVAIRQDVHHPGRALRPPVARIGDVAGERHAHRALRSSSAAAASAGRLPSGRCDSRARAGVPSGSRMPPCVLRIRTSGRRIASGCQPMPAFCVQPKRSPLGRSSRSAGSSGRAPAGPGRAVSTVSRTERSDSQVRSASAGNEDIWSHYRLPMLMRWPARWRRPVRFVGDVGILALLGYVGAVAYLYAYQVDLVFRPPPHGSLVLRERRRSRPSGSSSPASAAWPRRRGAVPARRGAGDAPATGSSSCTATRRRSARARTCAATISCGSSGLNVLAVEYPGFGDVGGTASEAGMHAAARAAYDRLRRVDGVPASHIAIYGWSLGTGAAVPLARDVDEAALIAEGGFTSVLARARRAASVHAGPLAAATSLQVRRGDRRARTARRSSCTARTTRSSPSRTARRCSPGPPSRSAWCASPAATSTRTPRTPTATARPSTTS